MEFTFGSIKLKIIDNHISIPGTDELKDFKISCQCWPISGYHAGCYKWVMANIQKIRDNIDETKAVYISGHSLGGSIAQVLGCLLQDAGMDVELSIQGAFPAVIYQQLKGIAEVYGNDPIPGLFPWFRFPVQIVYTGSDRKWWKINFSDHVGYWND